MNLYLAESASFHERILLQAPDPSSGAQLATATSEEQGMGYEYTDDDLKPLFENIELAVDLMDCDAIVVHNPMRTW